MRPNCVEELLARKHSFRVAQEMVEQPIFRRTEIDGFAVAANAMRGQVYDVIAVGGPDRAADLIEAAAEEFLSAPSEG